MNYITVFVLGIILGLFLSVVLKFVLNQKKRIVVNEVNHDWATKQEVEKLKSELEELKRAQKESEDMLRAEKEFYESALT